jgi:hypothetical protein
MGLIATHPLAKTARQNAYFPLHSLVFGVKGEPAGPQENNFAL